MADQSFYVVHGESRGPVDLSTLSRLAREGTVIGTSLVWREGLPDWKEASTFVELFPPDTIAPLSPTVTEGC